MIKKFAMTAFALSISAAFAANQPTTPANTSAATNSAQPSTSMEAPKTSVSSSSASDGQVKQIQQALKDKGQDPGPVDGKMGPKTQAALTSFQQAQGLSGSGQADQQTLGALGVSDSQSASTASGLTSSNQPSSSANQPSTTGSTPATSSNSTPSSSNQPSSANSTSSPANSSSASQATTKQ